MHYYCSATPSLGIVRKQQKPPLSLPLPSQLVSRLPYLNDAIAAFHHAPKLPPHFQVFLERSKAKTLLLLQSVSHARVRQGTEHIGSEQSRDGRHSAAFVARSSKRGGAVQGMRPAGGHILGKITAPVQKHSLFHVLQLICCCFRRPMGTAREVQPKRGSTTAQRLSLPPYRARSQDESRD
jgi:hypothetical protein